MNCIKKKLIEFHSFLNYQNCITKTIKSKNSIDIELSKKFIIKLLKKHCGVKMSTYFETPKLC